MSSSASFPQLETLTTQVAELVHNWGFKRIHGKIWSQLFLSNRPLDAADLIAQLDISKALVSISIRELLEVKAVEDVGRSHRGTHLYRANENLEQIGLELMRKREKALIASTREALASLKAAGVDTLNAHTVSETQIQALDEKLGIAALLVDSYIESHSPKPAHHEEPEIATSFSSNRGSSSNNNDDNSHSFTTVLPNGAMAFSARAYGG